MNISRAGKFFKCLFYTRNKIFHAHSLSIWCIRICIRNVTRNVIHSFAKERKLACRKRVLMMMMMMQRGIITKKGPEEEEKEQEEGPKQTVCVRPEGSQVPHQVAMVILDVLSVLFGCLRLNSSPLCCCCVGRFRSNNSGSSSSSEANRSFEYRLSQHGQLNSARSGIIICYKFTTRYFKLQKIQPRVYSIFHSIKKNILLIFAVNSKWNLNLNKWKFKDFYFLLWTMTGTCVFKTTTWLFFFFFGVRITQRGWGLLGMSQTRLVSLWVCVVRVYCNKYPEAKYLSGLLCVRNSVHTWTDNNQKGPFIFCAIIK